MHLLFFDKGFDGLAILAYVTACHCIQAAFTASLMGGSIGGIVVGLLMVILVSLPLCCGVLKQYGKAWTAPKGRFVQCCAE